MNLKHNLDEFKQALDHLDKEIENMRTAKAMALKQYNEWKILDKIRLDKIKRDSKAKEETNA